MKDKRVIKDSFFKEYRDQINQDSLDEKLYENIVAKLKDEDLFELQKTTKIRKWLVAASLVIITFSAGFIIGQSNLSLGETDNYMILLVQDEDFNPPAEANLVSEYSIWMNSVSEMGIQIDGSQLQDITNAQIIQPEDTLISITGFFSFYSESHTKALEIAHNMPHLKNGGKIRLMKIH